ncbi:hypothetical protein [Pseudoxanthomonas sp. Root630]|uniref:hypothetical protein n=2 Tax=Pseudoxanthomonas TaxID=83618 RepID=UPI0012DC729A|nr:hypothetical protein [Pseudoxanthomonas sp. Root630]
MLLVAGTGAPDRNAAFAGIYKNLTMDGVEAEVPRHRVVVGRAHVLRQVQSKLVPPCPEPAVMTHDSLTDELLSQLPINRDTRWTAGSLGLDEAAFDAVAQRLLELETVGAVDVMNLSRDASNGLRRLNAIRFMRVA